MKTPASAHQYQIEDVLASRPAAAAANAGFEFLATDTGETFYSNGTSWIATGDGGGAGGSSAESSLGDWEYLGDGFGAVILPGDMRVTVGVGATPSGIGQILINSSNKDSVLLSKVFAGTGGNNFLKIWNATRTDYWLYQITLGAAGLLSLSYIGDTGGGGWTTNDILSFNLITTTNYVPRVFRYSGQVTLPNNITNWVTYPLTGYNSPTLNRDIGTTISTGLTNNWFADRETIPGNLLNAKFRLRAIDGTGGDVTVEVWKQAKTAGGTGVTNTRLSTDTIAVPVGNTVDINRGNFTAFTTGAWAAHECIGVVIKRATGTAPLNIQLEYTLNGTITG